MWRVEAAFCFPSLHAQLDSQIGLMVGGVRSDGVSGTGTRCEITSLWTADTELRGLAAAKHAGVTREVKEIFFLHGTLFL